MLGSGSSPSTHGPEVSPGPSCPHQNDQFTREALWAGTTAHHLPVRGTQTVNHPSIHFGGFVEPANRKVGEADEEIDAGAYD